MRHGPNGRSSSGSRGRLRQGDIFRCPPLSQRELQAVADEQRRLQARLSNAVTEQRVAYLGLSITVSPGVFPPRPDSVVLAHALFVDEIPNSTNVLDFGTGSGVLSIVAGTRLGWKTSPYRGSLTVVDIARDAVLNADKNLREHFPSFDDPAREPQSRKVSGEPCDDELWWRAYAGTDGAEPQFPPSQTLGLIVANLPLRDVSIDDLSNPRNPQAPLRLIQRTMWDPDLVAHRYLLSHAHDWLEPSGRILMTVANYGTQNVESILTLIYQNGWEIRVVGVRDFYPCQDPNHEGVPLRIACLQLTRGKGVERKKTRMPTAVRTDLL